MAEDQETTSVIDLPLTGDHGSDLDSEALIFPRETITASLSSSGQILPQDLMTIQSLDSHSTAPLFTVGGVAVSSNTGVTTGLTGEIAMSQSDALAVTEYQLVDSGNGELIMVTSASQKDMELAGVQAGTPDQGQTITLSIDQATQLYLQQHGLNRSIQLPDGSLQILNPSLVQVEKEDGSIEAQELSLQVLQALQGDFIQPMASLNQNYALAQPSHADDESVADAKRDHSPEPQVKDMEEEGEELPPQEEVSKSEGNEEGKDADEFDLVDKSSSEMPEVASKEKDEQTEAALTESLDLKKESEPASCKESTEKVPDLNCPIPLTDQTVVMIQGKKCVLAFNEDTQQVCAYPIKPPPGVRKRGRPKLTTQQKQEMAAKKKTQRGSLQTEEPAAPSEQNTAAETLLELSSIGADGVRRSARKRKKARLFEAYEELEDSDEDQPFVDNQDKDPDITLSLPDAKKRKSQGREEAASLNALPTPPIKRGRGRPRRYPPPGQTPTPTSIPAVIIPSSNGQTLVMTSIAGLQNLPNFQRQLPNLVPKPSIDITSSSAPIPSDTTDTATLSLGGEPDPLPLDASEALDSNSIIPTALQGDTVPLVGNEGDNTDTSDHADTLDNTGGLLSLTPQGSDKTREETSEATVEQLAQPAINTMIQIPDNLLPMLGIKRDPIKIGLKASERELEKLKCPKCDFQCFYNQQYRTHIATHGDDIHKCKCCSYVSLDSTELLTHFKEFHPRCICPECDFMAEHAYIIKRHMMRHNAKSCTCQVCGKVYKDMYILKMHVKMVHMPPEVLFECTVCTKKFTRKAHLKRHLRIHEPEKPFKCPHCDYRGCERSDISKHMLIHEEPKHVCERCGKTFRHIKNKELHVKRHYGQRDYKCGVCEFFGYTFTDIRKHIERKHQDMKTLICDKCNKHFKSEFSLKEHQQVCNVMMIEQILAIPTSAGGTSQATIQIPTVVGPDGQRIILDGSNMAVDGQAVTMDGHSISVDGQDITLDKSGGVNIMVADQQLGLPAGSVGVEDSEMEEEEVSLNGHAMQIVGQTIMTETGEELHIIENPIDSLVAGESHGGSQRVVLLHQGLSEEAQLGGESSQIEIEEEFIKSEEDLQGDDKVTIATSEEKLEEELPLEGS